MYRLASIPRITNDKEVTIPLDISKVELTALSQKKKRRKKSTAEQRPLEHHN